MSLDSNWWKCVTLPHMGPFAHAGDDMAAQTLYYKLPFWGNRRYPGSKHSGDLPWFTGVLLVKVGFPSQINSCDWGTFEEWLLIFPCCGVESIPITWRGFVPLVVKLLFGSPYHQMLASDVQKMDQCDHGGHSDQTLNWLCQKNAIFTTAPPDLTALLLCGFWLLNCPTDPPHALASKKKRISAFQRYQKWLCYPL